MARQKTKTPEDYKAYNRQYSKSYREHNPDRYIKWRLTTAKNLLERHGYTVLDPIPDIEDDQEG